MQKTCESSDSHKIKLYIITLCKDTMKINADNVLEQEKTICNREGEFYY